MSKLEGIVEKCGKGLRYTLGSYLPKEVQKEMADKHGEDPTDYLLGTVFSEMGLMVVIGIGGLAVAGPVGGAIGLGIGFHAIFDTLRLFGNGIYDNGSWGHPITTIPYHMVKPPLMVAKKIKEHYDQPVDYVTLYTKQPRKFKRYFLKLSEEEKKEAINNILASREVNEKLDKWLDKTDEKLVNEVCRDRVYLLPIQKPLPPRGRTS